MTPAPTRPRIVAIGHPIEVGRQVGVGVVGGRTRDRATVVSSAEVPAYPVRLAQRRVIVYCFDRTLDQVMAIIVGIRGSAAGVAQLQLQAGVNNRSEERRVGKECR